MQRIDEFRLDHDTQDHHDKRADLMAGKPGRSGAPKGNRNHLTNGKQIHRLALGQLPKDMARVTRYCREYRRGLESIVAEANEGCVTIVEAHLIDAAATHEQHCQVCRWLMRHRLPKMSTADIRECSRQIAGAKDARNKCVKELNLDRDTHKDAIAVLYASAPDNLQALEDVSVTPAQPEPVAADNDQHSELADK